MSHTSWTQAAPPEELELLEVVGGAAPLPELLDELLLGGAPPVPPELVAPPLPEDDAVPELALLLELPTVEVPEVALLEEVSPLMSFSEPSSSVGAGWAHATKSATAEVAKRTLRSRSFMICFSWA